MSGNENEEFGANDWLVAEMYEQWKANPDSVDKAWWPILERYSGQTPPAATAPTTPAATPITPAAPVASPVPTEPASAAAPVAETPLVAKTTRIEPKPTPIPAQAPATGLIETIEDESGEDQVNVLKGMQKALASNMDASLEVPTATSVRAIPAKLMIDNRIVINSHLARTRGGKVSFTHLIGFAIIRALK